MIVKVNHTEENIILAISWVGALASYLFDHIGAAPLVLSCVASCFVIYEKYLTIKKKKNE